MTKLCECGCGKPTPIATKTCTATGRVKGQPTAFLRSHSARSVPAFERDPKPYDVEDRGYETPCWIWRYGLTTHGYGVARGRGLRRAAHRMLYEKAKGPIPEGLQLDHLCRVRACVNPDHLEPVTGLVNSRRGAATKLSDEEAAVIRASAEDNRVLGARYGVSSVQIARIKRGASRALRVAS